MLGGSSAKDDQNIFHREGLSVIIWPVILQEHHVAGSGETGQGVVTGESIIKPAYGPFKSGGLQAFGFVGLVLGPLVFALLMSIIDIYKRSFRIKRSESEVA